MAPGSRRIAPGHSAAVLVWRAKPVIAGVSVSRHWQCRKSSKAAGLEMASGRIPHGQSRRRPPAGPGEDLVRPRTAIEASSTDPTWQTPDADAGPGEAAARSGAVAVAERRINRRAPTGGGVGRLEDHRRGRGSARSRCTRRRAERPGASPPGTSSVRRPRGCKPRVVRSQCTEPRCTSRGGAVGQEGVAAIGFTAHWAHCFWARPVFGQRGSPISV